MLLVCKYIAELMASIVSLGGSPTVLEENGPYARYQMADSCYIESYSYIDSVLIVETVCAPICASHARVINNEGITLRDIPYPTTGMLHEAHIDSVGKLSWTDYTDLLLDDSERK